MNVEYVKTTSALSNRMVPWPLTPSLAQGPSVGIGYLHHTMMYGMAVDELRIIKPVEVGDTVHVVIEVLDKRESRGHPDRGIVQV